MRAKITVLTVLSILSVSLLTSTTVAGSPPAIGIHEPPSRSFPLKVYVYQMSIDLDNNSLFECETGSKITALFYDVLRTFPKVILRFIDEYPEYRRLALIYFENVSAPSDATITFRIIRERGEPSVAYVNHWKEGAEIYVKCSILDWGLDVTHDEVKAKNLAWSVIAHELGHALGLDHAMQMYTVDGHPELMYFGGFGDEKIYYSSLDLYALYIAYFGNPEYYDGRVNITLPPNIEYKMVTPYDVELYKLRLEEEHLKNQVDELTRDLRNVTETIKRLNAENTALKKRLLGLEDQLTQLKTLKKDLEEQLTQAQAEVSRLQEDVTALQALNNKLQLESQNLRDKNSLLESQNQELRNRLKEYERQSLFLALIALAAATLALGLAIHAKRKGALK